MTQVDLEYLLNAANTLPAPPLRDVESVSTYLEGLALTQQQPVSEAASFQKALPCHPSDVPCHAPAARL